MADTALSYAARLKRNEDRGPSGSQEFKDTPLEFQQKLLRLRNGLCNAHHVLIHTGAGISTNSGISDFRGPTGVWTLDDEKNIKITKSEKVKVESHLNERKIQKNLIQSSSLNDQKQDKEKNDRKRERLNERIDETIEKSKIGITEIDEEPPVVAGGRILGRPVYFSYALPSLTHCFIAELLKLPQYNLRGVISQNVDGLHVRSSVSFYNLTEVHGNLFTERCTTCQRRYFREYVIPTIGFHKSGHRCHICWTPEIFGRCPKRKKQSSNLSSVYIGLSCHNGLGLCRDVTLDWADPYEDFYLETSKQWSRHSDFHLCLGTSLFVNPAGTFPLLYRKRQQSRNRVTNLARTNDISNKSRKKTADSSSNESDDKTQGKIVVVNFQKSALHNDADLVLHCDVDLMTAHLSQMLNIKIPVFTRFTNVVIVSYNSILPPTNYHSELFTMSHCVKQTTATTSSSASNRRSPRLAEKRTKYPCMERESETKTQLTTQSESGAQNTKYPTYNCESTESPVPDCLDAVLSEDSRYYKKPHKRRRKKCPRSLTETTSNSESEDSKGLQEQEIKQLQHFKNYRLSKCVSGQIPTTTIISCGAIKNIALIKAENQLETPHSIKVEQLDALKKIWFITFYQACDVLIQFFYGRELKLRLYPKLPYNENLSGSIWKVGVVNKVFHLPPALPVYNVDVISSTKPPTSLLSPIPSYHMSDFKHPTSSVHINSSDPVLVAILHEHSSPKSMDLEWSSNASITTPINQSSQLDDVSELKFFPFPSKASLLYHLISRLPTVVEPPFTETFVNEDVDELFELCTSLGLIPDNSENNSSSASFRRLPSKSSPDNSSNFEKSRTFLQPFLRVDRAQLGSLLLKCDRLLRKKVHSKLKPRFELNEVTAALLSTPKKLPISMTYVKLMEKILCCCLSKDETTQNALRQNNMMGVYPFDNINNYPGEDNNSNKFVSLLISNIGLSLLRDLQYFPLWIVGYLSDVFSCR